MEYVDQRIDHFDRFCWLPFIEKTSKVLKKSTFFYLSLHIFWQSAWYKSIQQNAYFRILALFSNSTNFFFFWKVLVSLPSYISLKKKLHGYRKRDRKNSDDESWKKVSFFRELLPLSLVESGCIMESWGWVMRELSQNPRKFPWSIDQSHLLCCSESLCHVWFFATPWTVACQAPLSMEILQARRLEWVAIPSSRGSSQPKDWTQVSLVAGRFFTVWANRDWISDVNTTSCVNGSTKHI